MSTEIRASELQVGDTYQDGGDPPIVVAAVDWHGDTVLVSGEEDGTAVAATYDGDTVVTLLERDPQPPASEKPENWWLVVEQSGDYDEANVAITAGDVRLNVRVTTEGIIADSYSPEGDCIGTIGDDFDGWARRIENDPAQKPLWDNDLVQFARLLDEIQGCCVISYQGLRESMDLDDDGIAEIFERARIVFENSKAAL